MARSKTELLRIQAELEREMTAKGAEKFYKNLNYKKAVGAEDSTVYGSALMKHKIDAFALIIKTWKERYAGKPGKKARAYGLLVDLDNHVLSYLGLKGILANISVPTSQTTVALSIGDLIEEELQMEGLRKQDNKLVKNLLYKGRHATTKERKKVYMMDAIQKGGKTWKVKEKWSKADRLLAGVVLIDLAARELELVQIATTNTKAKRQSRKVIPNPTVQDWIQNLTDTVAVTRPVREPMVVSPRDWKSPFNGGYLTSNIAPLKMVKGVNRNYLSELANTDMPIVYEAINGLQRVPFQINSQVFKLQKKFFDEGVEVGGIPSKHDMEYPVTPNPIPEKGTLPYKEWKHARAQVRSHNTSLGSTRVSFHMGLDIASRYNKYKEIYFPYQLDFRGRMYAVPYLNPQSADHHKALLRFSYGRPLGTEGWKWLAIHGANVAGFDKVSLQDRVQWVLDNEEEILSIATDPEANRSWSHKVGEIEIDQPWMFLAFCIEWKGYVNHGDSFISKLPVSLDGSCSGIQHFSAMFLDEKGGEAVNLLPSEIPQDVYKLVADEVIKQLEHDAIYGIDYEDKTMGDGNIVTVERDKTFARQWLKFGVNRKTTKRSVMTLAYGSREYGFRQQILEDILLPAYKAMIASGKTDTNNDAFPFTHDGFMAAGYMAGLIWDKVKIVLVKATEAMDWLQKAAGLLSREGLPVRWNSPVGFPVLQEYYDEKMRRVVTNLNGKSVEFFLHERVDKISKAKQSQGVAPNFVHSCDAAHMMLTIARARQEGMFNFAMVHDSFGVCAGECERMFHLVRETFVEMYNDIDVFGNFKLEVEQQLSEKHLPELPMLPEKGTLDITKVLDSMYCFA